MADLPPYRTPRWVKIIGIIALVLVLVLGILHLTGLGGNHGPGRHLPSGGAGDARPLTMIIDQASFASGSGSHTLAIHYGIHQP